MKEHSASIHIIALAALGKGLSGGDRIFIELARRWGIKIPVYLYVWEEGWLMCQRENLSSKLLKICLVNMGKIAKLGFIFTYFYRVFLGIKLGFTLRVQDGDYIYSASEFWMDSLPAIFLKLRNPKLRWIAAWFQTAPNPLKGFSEGKRAKLYRLSAFLYWLVQLPIKPLISRFADVILVNNELEKRQFAQLEKRNKVLIVPGGVDILMISKYLRTHSSPRNKKYLAVFQGRFHPQKGVSELIDIWKLITKQYPTAKLAMIGDGPLMPEVKAKIRNLSLGNNIDLFGYLHNGIKKYSIFQHSKIVVHPAFYDSGGMASAEAMAFGLPCIGFDLKSYRFYYPKGMVKVPIGNYRAFAEAILKLENNKKEYLKISKVAQEMILKTWSWEERAKKLFAEIIVI